MKFNLIILLSLVTTLSFCQSNEGVAYYDVIRKIDMKGNTSMNFDFPNEIKSKRKLIFKDSISVFEVVQKEKEVNTDSPFNIHVIEPDNKFYIDRKTGMTREKKDFFGKTFLIESQNEPLKWYKTAEVKKIGDYFCQLATFRDTSITINAWYTPQIPNSFGPEKYGDLPGLIVLLVENEGKTIYNLKKIEFKPVGDILPPKKGKKVTREEYKKIIEEKLKDRKGRFSFYQDD